MQDYFSEILKFFIKTSWEVFNVSMMDHCFRWLAPPHRAVAEAQRVKSAGVACDGLISTGDY